MKKLIVGFLVLCIPPYLGGSTWIDNTFFMQKSQGLNTPIQLSPWHKAIFQEPVGDGVIVSASPFFNYSFNRYELGRYFFPNGTNTIMVASQSSSVAADVDPSNLGLPSDFSGKLTFCPEQRNIGLYLNLFQNLDNYISGLFWSASFPIVSCNSYLSATEIISNAGTPASGAPISILQALSGGQNNATWTQGLRYGKIDNRHHSKVGIADIDVKVGFRFFDRPSYKLGANLNLIIPSGTHAEDRYLFEPMIGNSRHIGIGIGLDGSYNLFNYNNSPRKYIRTLSHQRLIYLIDHRENRILGVKNKPWGHYMAMRQQDPEDTTSVLAGIVPGTTALRRAVDVVPGVQYDSTWVVEARWYNFTGSLGYNGWIRQQEQIRLRQSFTHDKVYGLASNNGTLNNELASVGVSSDSTIAAPAPGDGVFLTKENIVLKPHPSASSHTLFATIGLESPNSRYPISALIGSSYTIPSRNTALEQWGIWATLTAQF